MKLMKIVFLGISLFFCFCGALYAMDLQEGFSGIKWGIEVKNLENFKKVGSKNKVDYYIKPGVIHTFDYVEIPLVTYGFYSGRFFAIYAHIETPEVFAQMKHYVQSRYGIPVIKFTSESGNPTEYRWKKDKLKLKLKVQKYTGKMKLGIYYTPISRLVNESQQERYNETAFKLLPKDKPITPAYVPLLEF